MYGRQQFDHVGDIVLASLGQSPPNVGQIPCPDQILEKPIKSHLCVVSQTNAMQHAGLVIIKKRVAFAPSGKYLHDDQAGTIDPVEKFFFQEEPRPRAADPQIKNLCVQPLPQNLAERPVGESAKCLGGADTRDERGGRVDRRSAKPLVRNAVERIRVVVKMPGIECLVEIRHWVFSRKAGVGLMAARLWSFRLRAPHIAPRQTEGGSLELGRISVALMSPQIAGGR